MIASMGRSLLINSVAAVLIDHHLRAREQDISLLSQAVRNLIKANGMKMNRSGDNHLPFTNDIHVSSQLSGHTQTVFRLDDGRQLHMPLIVGSLKEDDDGDMVMTLREMMITREVIYNAIPSGVRLVLTRNLPETVVIAATGRPLAEIVSHPALDRMPLRAAAIANQPEGNRFNLRGTPAMGAAITLSTTGKIVLPLDEQDG